MLHSEVLFPRRILRAIRTQHMHLYFFFCKVHINQAWNGSKCSAISVGVYHKYSWMGTFQAWGVFSPPRRESLLENVTYVETKMFEETWLFDNLLLTHSWISSRELCGFLLPCWCWGAEGLHSSAGSTCGLRALGSSGLVGSQVWGLEGRSFGPPGFSVRWLTVISLAETLKGSRVCPSLCRIPLMTSRTCEVPQSKKTVNPPELGAVKLLLNCSDSFRGKQNKIIFFSTFLFLPQCP